MTIFIFFDYSRSILLVLVRWREDFIIKYVGIIINLHHSGL